MGREQNLLYLALSVAALGSLWLHYAAGRAPRQAAAGGAFDLFVNRPRLTLMDAAGRPARVLEAERMEHLPRQQRSRLQAPRLVVNHADGGRLRVSAAQGWLSDRRGPILLEGNVRVRLARRPVEP